ncbi:hypothetical protein CSQ79_21610 [Gloeocapsopsis sp. IPPAS B-1203]|nr:HepT-like ribonuclease domain-containing protein [Gloeocapsopsis sp. IPPAS B-1203]PIG91298.1 hypothetical protein CSQ79_21610 [Gloeocapsopsis sp. IPPAS B-1203]
MQFVKNMTFAEFEKDRKTIFASNRAIQITGEAAKKIPEIMVMMPPILEDLQEDDSCLLKISSN